MTPEELLKEVGEPVNFCSQYSLDRVAEYNNALVRIDSTFHEQSPVAIYTSDQVAAALLKATKPLEDQLAAAREEIDQRRQRVQELEKQRDELLAALKKFGEHLHTCDCVVDGEIPDDCEDEHDVCTCGFSAAIASMKGEQ